ncbi:MAG: hypothetical protein CSA33_02295 [Desulfobulbus propionicus]|nr:MAG: hypothetical protein CSA33_02295 [Desulfobulbus propionicus]
MYLVAIMDWHSRNFLSWRISNTLDSTFCINALEEDIDRFGPPDIFNTDQGHQQRCYPGSPDNQVSIGMDGQGRCQDNIIVERLWWTLKHQYIYLHSFESGRSLPVGLAKWIQYYNLARGHSSLDDKTPDEFYFGLPYPFAEAA